MEGSGQTVGCGADKEAIGVLTFDHQNIDEAVCFPRGNDHVPGQRSRGIGRSKRKRIRAAANDVECGLLSRAEGNVVGNGLCALEVWHRAPSASRHLDQVQTVWEIGGRRNFGNERSRRFVPLILTESLGSDGTESPRIHAGEAVSNNRDGQQNGCQSNTCGNYDPSGLPTFSFDAGGLSGWRWWVA